MKEISMILWGLGGLTFFSSIFFLKPGTPIASLNPKRWWVSRAKQRESFTGPGYALARVGSIWMAIGAAGWLVLLLLE